jgi:glycosyltransferase involved in cell wall biosynthesis
MVRVCLVGMLAGGHSGVPRYAAALTAALDRVAHEFSDLSLRLLTSPAGARAASAQTIEIELARGPFSTATAGPRRILAEQLAARRTYADLLHFFDLSGPILAPQRAFVTTVHDAAVRRNLELARTAHKRLLQPWSIRNARAIVAVSAFAKDESILRFGADASRVTVIHSGPGLGASVAESSPLALTNGAGSKQPPYLLFVGNLAAHKNLPFLVDTFGAADVEGRLVLVGNPGKNFEQIRGAIASAPAGTRIEVHRGASDAALDELYRRAAALVLPSRYEGFGFTALEAMARGCPVLASDIPALREICGDGAWLLPLDDREAWVHAMRRVLTDQGLAAELRTRGKRIVSRYSWERTARELCDLLLATDSRSR